MNMNNLSFATKLDIFSSIAIVGCLIILFVAADFSAPVLAVAGAVGAGATGVARLIYRTKRD